MKTRNLLALLLLCSGMLLFTSAKAQGTFTFTNNTTQTVAVTATAIYDDCVTNMCTQGPVLVSAGNSYNFTGCSGSGAWKEIKVADHCRSVQVGVCLSSSTSASVNLCTGTYTVTYTDEHTGDIQ